MTSEKKETQTETHGKSLLWELFFNLCLPTFLLMKGHTLLHVSPKIALALAISCPLSYGILDWIKEAHFNWIAFLGLISIVVKGSVGLLEGSNQLLAINEMLLPTIMGCGLFGMRLLRKPPFLMKFLLNEQFCNAQLILERLEMNKALPVLNKHVIMYEWSLSGLFFFSAVLNYLLARYLVVHPAGSVEFNHELGLLTGWNFAIIAVPATLGLLCIVWRFFTQVQKLSQLTWDELFKS